MNATEKEQSQRSVSSSSARQPEFKDPGGLRSEETGEDREMELGWKSTARRVISGESAAVPFSNISIHLMPPPKKSEPTIQKYSCTNSSSGGYLLLSPVPASTWYFNKSLFNKRNKRKCNHSEGQSGVRLRCFRREKVKDTQVTNPESTLRHLSEKLRKLWSG